MSDRETEIFNKELEKIVDKPKRKLSEKQLANLALGREKMKLKRELAKKNKEVKEVNKMKKIIKKEEIKGEKEQTKIKKTNLKVKRKTLKEINKEKQDAILERLQKQEHKLLEKKTERENLFNNLKVKCLEKSKTVAEYTKIKLALDGIDEDTLHDTEKLKKYAIDIMKPFIKSEKIKLEVIEE
tara:strand:- start:609 stop:1160 length:552 start_codon:yes stop_codon:yes gene_type:complete